MTTSTGLSILWCCPSMIHKVFVCDAYHPLFLAVWSSAAYHDDRHGRTMITYDVWRLTVKPPDLRWGYWPVAIHIRLFYAPCIICQASSCSIYFQKPGLASHTMTDISNFCTFGHYKLQHEKSKSVVLLHTHTLKTFGSRWCPCPSLSLRVWSLSWSLAVQSLLTSLLGAVLRASDILIRCWELYWYIFLYFVLKEDRRIQTK